MRQRIKIEKMRFGQCVVVEMIPRKAGTHNTQYQCLCDCGEKFIASGQQLRGTNPKVCIDRCPACRRINKKKRKMKAEINTNLDATKYTLMDTDRSKIIRGGNGIHIYTSKRKATFAARVMSAVAVPLIEAQKMENKKR